MNDLISRQAAIEAFYTATGDGDKADWCVGVIKELPSAQPDIVRCKDCKYYISDWGECTYTSFNHRSDAWDPHDYCSCGERKEKE